MNNYRQTYCLLLVFCLLVENSIARTQPTLEQTVAGGIAGAIESCMSTNGGLSLTNWEQIAPRLQWFNRRMLESGLEAVPAAYVFVPTNLYKPDGMEGRIIMSRSKPIKHDGRLGRFIVFETLDKEIREDWMREDDFQALLKQFGVTLPAPDLVAAQTAKAAVEKVIAEEQLQHAMIVAAAPKPTAAELREMWWWRIKSWFIRYDEDGQVTGVRPLSLAVVFSLLGLGVFGWRWLGKRKQQT